MKLYRSGMVQRYHSNPDLARFGQTNAAHQWGVAALILKLNPNPSRDLIVAALLHDVGELETGDLPAPFKIRCPGVADAHKEIEHEFRNETIGHLAGCFDLLTPRDWKWLELCDRLEAWFYAMVHNPATLEGDDWDVDSLLDLAEQCDVYTEVSEMID